MHHIIYKNYNSAFILSGMNVKIMKNRTMFTFVLFFGRNRRLHPVTPISGMAHHDQESIKPLFLELTTAAMVYDEPDKKRYSMGTLLDKAVVDYRHEATGDILVSWYFGRLFIEMAERSNHWAILDRQTVFHLQSKYSVLLFQYFASLQNLKHKTGEVFTVDQLRSMLGVEQGKLARFADLNARALQPAIAEINQLARFTLTATLRKTGRTVTSVEISWEPKPCLLYTSPSPRD